MPLPECGLVVLVELPLELFISVSLLEPELDEPEELSVGLELLPDELLPLELPVELLPVELLPELLPVELLPLELLPVELLPVELLPLWRWCLLFLCLVVLPSFIVSSFIVPLPLESGFACDFVVELPSPGVAAVLPP